MATYLEVVPLFGESILPAIKTTGTRPGSYSSGRLWRFKAAGRRPLGLTVERSPEVDPLWRRMESWRSSLAVLNREDGRTERDTYEPWPGEYGRNMGPFGPFPKGPGWFV
uniref:Transposase n=1 Tax=Steinernema glaseri TaxID=37863 RepID=A0A1I7Z770_9BILA